MHTPVLNEVRRWRETLSSEPNVRLSQPIDLLRRPEQRCSAKAVQRLLMTSVQHRVTELGEPAPNETSRKEAKAPKCAEGVVVAQ